MKKKSKISILIFIFLLVTVFYPLLEMLIRVEWSDFGSLVSSFAFKEALSNLLKEVYETTGIKAEGDKIVCDDSEVEAWAKPESNVSMNMWAGYPDFLDYLEKDFSTFLANISDNPMKKEYLLPNIVAELLREDRINVKVLETHDKWFGVTVQKRESTRHNKNSRLIHSP